MAEVRLALWLFEVGGWLLLGGVAVVALVVGLVVVSRVEPPAPRRELVRR
jgi:hypothetical protein